MHRMKVERILAIGGERGAEEVLGQPRPEFHVVGRHGYGFQKGPTLINV